MKTPQSRLILLAVSAAFFLAGSVSAAGSISIEKWEKIPGKTTDLIPTDSPPDFISELQTFEAPVNVGNSYGIRVRGFLTAPVSGTYRFWVAGDDNVELYLSTDETRGNSVRIAHHDGWTRSRTWNKYDSQKSGEIQLSAGYRYYIEALMKEDAGRDNLAVGWALPGQDTIAPSEVIPGSALSPYAQADSYIINALAGPGGKITPEGPQAVPAGMDTTFAITADNGYVINDVIVDDVSVGPVPSYTFENVDAPHTITASFRSLNTVLVHQAEVLELGGSAVVNEKGNGWSFSGFVDFLGGEGTFSSDSIKIPASGTYDIVVTYSTKEDRDLELVVNDVYHSTTTYPASGSWYYDWQDITITGVGLDEATNSLSFATNGGSGPNIDKVTIVGAEPASFTVYAAQSAAYWIDPGTSTVSYGDSLTFTIHPLDHVVITDVLVDGQSVGPVSSYTFTNITADHTIEAIYQTKTYEITAMPSAAYYIEPESAIVPHGSSQTFTINPIENVVITDVLVDRESVGAVSEYTFENVRSNHSIQAVWEAPAVHTVFVHQSATFNIEPTDIRIPHGGSQTVVITPHPIIEITDVYIDGESVGPALEYTFTNVTSSHELWVGWTMRKFTIKAIESAGYDISPDSAIVIYDDSVTFTISPMPETEITDVLVDGESVGAVSEYTFHHVSSDKIIEAAYAMRSNGVVLPGRIQAEDYNEGREDIGYHDSSPGNSGGEYRNEDVDIQTTYDIGGEYNVGWTTSGEWLAYDVDVPETGTYALTARVASARTSDRAFRIEVDGVDVTGPVYFPGTGAWQNWTDVTVDGIALEAGPRVVKFIFETGAVNLNYLDVSFSSNQ